MKHAVSQELFRYWDQLRGARNAPERGDLDPAAIRGILADTFILEVVTRASGSEREFPIRLSGTRLNALFMDEMKGRSLVSLWQPAQRHRIEEMLEGVLDDQAAMVAGVKAAPGDAVSLELELLLLPLRHHGRTHCRILGALAPFQVPSWLGLRPVTYLDVTSSRTVTGPAVSVLRLATSIASATQRSGVRHGHFTVHDGGR